MSERVIVSIRVITGNLGKGFSPISCALALGLMLDVADIFRLCQFRRRNINFVEYVSGSGG
ncbi:hypothetical protein FE394_13510 [Xenorhabdus sp. Reich]|uniref:Uncharacterized protein n=1 Tax=Xenorhabdus littoralis TaxID=2582835 RepID=A0ABU4SNN8_9GAMM|nr:hypothetical protein [Xenorhabdus sp. Reich]MDX8000189.1 hypothetical protein [Xenorhabdus sp. Reich]